MKEARNNIDKTITFSDLNEMKKYYLPKDNIPCTKEEYLGDDYEEFCEQYLKYKEEIKKAETLEDLTDVLNRYTDTYGDGRVHKVIGD